MGLLEGPAVEATAGICAFTALLIAIFQIICHLRNYTGPVFQRYIVRIIFMVPVYSIMSWFSLMFESEAIYFESVRDCYEAWVIYNFLSLCLAFVGGPGAVEIKMNGYILTPSCYYMTCCLPPLAVNGRFVRYCKQLVLQFVIVKPIMAAITVTLYATGNWTDGYWGPNSGYLYIQVVYNITYTLALYALLLFYLGTHELLAPYNPLLKFVLVKSVIFLTFWQSLFVSILAGTGVIPEREDGKRLQNYLICLEMLPAAIFMLFAFPYSEYKATGPNAGLGIDNVRHAISVRDVVSDTVHQFAPTYHNYVLYSNGASKGAPKPQPRTQKTFVGPDGKPQNSRGRKATTDGKESDKSNLLAHMELGIHASHLSDDELQGASSSMPQRSDNPFAEDNPYGDPFSANDHGLDSPEYGGHRMLDVDEDGIEMSSASVSGHTARAKNGVLVKLDTEDRESDAHDTALEMLDDGGQPTSSQQPSPDWHNVDLGSRH